MSDNDNQPLFQKILENNWVLLAIGLIFPLVFYTIWGFIELYTLPHIDYSKEFANYVQK